MALTPEQQAEIAALRARAASDYNALLEDEKRRLIELQNLEQEILGTSESKVSATIRQITLLEEEIKLNETLKELGETTVGAYANILSQEQNLLDLRKQNLKLARQNKDIDEDKFKKKLEDLAAEQKSLRARKQGYQDSENFAKRFFGITRQPTSEFGKFLVDPAGRLEGLTKGLGEVIDPMSVLTSTVDKVVESTLALAVEQDQAIVTFNKATGASGEFDKNIQGLERSLFTAGVTSAEAGQAVQSLFLNVSDFTEMSKGQQETLGKTVAVLGELGISSETAAKNIQFATKVLGQSTSQAAALQRELFVFAQELGVSASQIAGDFQTLAPQIAAMGKNGVDAFKNLEAQSKSTGLAMNELLQIVQKFDRFDTAAESVSRLNALLGGPFLNATELVAETDLSKRFEILKNRLDDAGLSFDQMDYYQRKATASAMGLNEQQLALLMRGRIDLVQAPQKSAAELEALADQTAQFNTLAEEMKQAAMALAVSFGPLVSMLKSTIQFLSPILEAMSRYPGLAFGMIGGISALLRGFALLRLKITEMTVAERRSLILFAAMGSIGLIAQLVELGHGMAAFAVAVGAVTAAVAALVLTEKASVILGGLGLVTMGISALVHSMTVGNSPSLVEAFMMVAAAIPFMTLALMALMPLLPGLLLFIPPLALGFAALASSLEYLFEDKTVTNLKLISAEIANIVDKINELDTTKAIAVTATTAVAAGASAISGIAAGAMDAIGINVGATTPETAAAAAPAGVGGPPAEIKLNITIDGESIAGAINNVEVSNYVKGQRSKLYDSIIDAVVGTQLVSS